MLLLSILQQQFFESPIAVVIQSGFMFEFVISQDPQAFQKTIASSVKARQGRALNCHVVTGMYNWKEHLGDMGVQLHGHTQTHYNMLNNLEAVHYFELQLRSSLPPEQKDLVKELLPTKHEDDVILSVKKQLSDKTFSQVPMVFVPAPQLKGLSGHPGFVPRPEVSVKTQKDLLKTADKVEAAPWKMFDSAKYLRKLAKGDFPQQPTCRELPSVAAWKDGVMEVKADAIGDGELDFTSRTAAEVSVKAKATACKSKAVAPIPPPPSPPPSLPDANADMASEGGVSLPSQAGTPELPAVVGPEIFKRPASGSVPKAPAKKAKSDAVPAAAKAKAEALSEPKAPPPPKKNVATRKATLDRIILPKGVTLGCSKCRGKEKKGPTVGCAQCRKKAGLTYNPETGMWS